MCHLEKIDGIRTEYRKKKILIVSGIEWTTSRIHLNLLGVRKWKSKIRYKPKDNDILNAINQTHDQGGIVVCNHIPWSVNEFHMHTHPSREKLLEWGVDFIEIVNDDCLPENVYDHESYLFCNKYKSKIGMITGTDMHKPDDLASGGVHGWTLMNLKELSEEGLMEQLKKRKTEILYSNIPYLIPRYYK
jgi:hypothetical protein